MKIKPERMGSVRVTRTRSAIHSRSANAAFVSCKGFEVAEDRVHQIEPGEFNSFDFS